LADGVVAFAVGPTGLLRSKAGDGYVRGDEPILLIVSGAELLEKNPSEQFQSLARCSIFIKIVTK
jgi:hypothetical protein